MNISKHPRLAALALTVALVAGSALPAAALEFSGLYLAPKAVYGISKLDGIKQEGTLTRGWGSTDKSTWGGGLALGYNLALFNVPLRGEVEYLAFGNTKASRSDATTRFRQHVGVQSVLFNFFWDIPTSTRFTPYIGAGLGVGILDAKANVDTTGNNAATVSTGWDNRAQFAWNVGAGVSYAFTERFALDLGYRYADYGEAKSPTVTNAGYTLRSKTDLTMHQILLSARFAF